MPRKPRDNAPGVFHVAAHSIWPGALFADDVDRTIFLDELRQVVATFKWMCLSVCLMDTHYHLILEIEDFSLSAGMQALNACYACGFNARHRTRGHAFSGRYGSKRIDTDGYLLVVYAYVANNPVRAGICRSPSDGLWSSFASLGSRGGRYDFVDPSRIVGLFGDDREQAIVRLRENVEAAAALLPLGSG